MRYKKYEVEISLAQYANGRTAIQLVDANDGSPIARATVNLPDEDLDDNEVILNVNDGMEDMHQFLHENDIVGTITRWVRSGFVAYPVCPLL